MTPTDIRNIRRRNVWPVELLNEKQVEFASPQVAMSRKKPQFSLAERHDSFRWALPPLAAENVPQIEDCNVVSTELMKESFEKLLLSYCAVLF